MKFPPPPSLYWRVKRLSKFSGETASTLCDWSRHGEPAHAYSSSSLHVKLTRRLLVKFGHDKSVRWQAQELFVFTHVRRTPRRRSRGASKSHGHTSSSHTDRKMRPRFLPSRRRSISSVQCTSGQPITYEDAKIVKCKLRVLDAHLLNL